MMMSLKDSSVKQPVAKQQSPKKQSPRKPSPQKQQQAQQAPATSVHGHFEQQQRTTPSQYEPPLTQT